MLKIRRRFDVHKLHDHQRLYTNLWLEWGLHRGHLKTEAGKAGSPFGYDIDYYHLGHPTVVGYSTPHGRGTTEYPVSHAIVQLLQETQPAEWDLVRDSPLNTRKLQEARTLLKALRDGTIKPIFSFRPDSKKRLILKRPIKDKR